MSSQSSALSRPGIVALFGSGETSASGQKIFDAILRQLPQSPRVALIETPAGFELNSDRVIGRVGEFLNLHLQNYQPEVITIPARARGSEFSPDNPQVVDPMCTADMLFMGPGSPSYAVRQLQGSLLWDVLLACHRAGAAIALSSAAVIAIGAYALPVYEIYKVGEELHWKPGLDLLGQYGLSLVFIPHWNNNEGGEDLDTSRCFMGKSRFTRLVELLPPDLAIIGIDENTGLLIDPQTGDCQVIGSGGVTLIHTGQARRDALSQEELARAGLAQVADLRHGHVHRFQRGQCFSLPRRDAFHPPTEGTGLPADVWQKLITRHKVVTSKPEPSSEVLALLEERLAARRRKDWPAADAIRTRLLELGWRVKDTADGSQLEPVLDTSPSIE